MTFAGRGPIIDRRTSPPSGKSIIASVTLVLVIVGLIIMSGIMTTSNQSEVPDEDEYSHQIRILEYETYARTTDTEGEVIRFNVTLRNYGEEYDEVYLYLRVHTQNSTYYPEKFIVVPIHANKTITTSFFGTDIYVPYGTIEEGYTTTCEISR